MHDNNKLTSSLIGHPIIFFLFCLSYTTFPHLEQILNVILDVPADEDHVYVYLGYKCYQCATKCFGWH
jgi:hypothetical protein